MTKLYRNSFGNLSPSKMVKNKAHTGLLYSIGLEKVDDDSEKPNITKLLDAVVSVKPPPIYKTAFDSRKKYLENLNNDSIYTNTWLCGCISRLLLGLGDENVVENGIRLNGTYGMPIIPGSSIKGVSSSLVYSLFKDKPDSTWFPGKYEKEKCLKKPGLAYKYTFGTEEESGNVIFHDAWYKPSVKPFVKEVISVHHQEYYSHKSQKASEGDTPVPNHFIASHGSFMFSISSPDKNWTNEIEKLVKQALSENGVGAKGTSGYGLFISNDKAKSESISEREGTLIFKPNNSEWRLNDSGGRTIAKAKGNKWLNLDKDKVRNFIKNNKGKKVKVEVKEIGERDLEIIKFIKKL